MLSSMSTSEFIADWNDSPPVARPDRRTYQQRAIAIWPGLDRRRLRRTQGDPWRIARLVASRTSLSLETILFLLIGPEIEGRVQKVGPIGLPRSIT